MEENELILLKNSKKHIVKAGKWLNIFSIFAAISVLFMVAGGVFLLFFSGTLDESTPYYLDNILGFSGIAVILFAAASLAPIVFMRRAVHAADQVRVNNDMLPSVEYLSQVHYLCHYVAWLMIVCFLIAIVASAVALIVFWPQLTMVMYR
ncbi:MAG: hypothetical protein IJM33_07835 [Bacteroidales bacterium]|nr:hypothetical protein [Bacteroidales bacterium]MBR3414041.1 hypothetical protein [Bacteroidales bacterium]